MTEHVVEDLELYAVGALPPVETQRVAVHLAGCPACRAEAEELAAVVSALPETLDEREPPAALGARILATARADLRRPAASAIPLVARGRTPWRPRLGRAWLPMGALAAAVILLVVIDLDAARELRNAAAERDEYAGVVTRLSEGGRWWYMAGKDDFAGAGGTLIVPRRDGQAFVLFHDLKPLEPQARLTVWLVSADGQRWVRGANVTPNGKETQVVYIEPQVAGFDRCAVTLESGDPPSRRIIMESRISTN